MVTSVLCRIWYVELQCNDVNCATSNEFCGDLGHIMPHSHEQSFGFELCRCWASFQSKKYNKYRARNVASFTSSRDMIYTWETTCAQPSPQKKSVLPSEAR